MYPNETAEHHRDHPCRNKKVNQFCYDPISKYRGNFCGCITRHHPVWAGSRSWVSRHLSLHLSIRGDEVRVPSCLIFRYCIWPKKQCVLEKHSNLLQKYNSCRLLLTITHKYLSSHEFMKTLNASDVLNSAGDIIKQANKVTTSCFDFRTFTLNWGTPGASLTTIIRTGEVVLFSGLDFNGKQLTRLGFSRGPGSLNGADFFFGNIGGNVVGFGDELLYGGWWRWWLWC